MSLKEVDWDDLLNSIDEHKCTPFIGAGACAGWIPLGSEIAGEWAEKYNYPLGDSGQLARVAQFLGIDRGNDMYPKIQLSRRFKQIVPPDFSNLTYQNSVHAVLADLSLPVYITTNYDEFMEAALRSRRRNPDREFCKWNKFPEIAEEKSVFETPDYKPSEDRPLVYHLHGHIDTPQSMVLTESDYIDFIINLYKEGETNVLPRVIRKALAATSLLFIGYSLEDINFRIIFRGLMSLLGSSLQLPSIAVQLPPRLTSEKQEQAQRYLDQYTQSMFKVQVYWGDAQNFVSDLRQRWEKFKNAK